MKFYRMSRHETFGTFSFDAYQFWVASMMDANFRTHHGIVALYSGGMDAETPYPMTAEQAKPLITFLRALPSADLPSKYTIRGSRINYWTSIRIKVRNRSTDGRGAYFSGSMTRGQLLGFSTTPARIYEASILGFANALAELYEYA